MNACGVASEHRSRHGEPSVLEIDLVHHRPWRAFDIIELNGDDLRREALVSRKVMLAIALAGTSSGIELNEHLEHDNGALVFQHACKLGLEGIVSKRKDWRYQSGRCPHWMKMRNPACEAVRREAEEDWRL